MRKDRRAERLNFERIDSVLDFIVMNKMHPVIDLGDKPKRVLRNAGNPLFVDVHPPIFQSMEESRWIFEAFSDHNTAVRRPKNGALTCGRTTGRSGEAGFMIILKPSR